MCIEQGAIHWLLAVGHEHYCTYMYMYTIHNPVYHMTGHMTTHAPPTSIKTHLTLVTLRVEALPHCNYSIVLLGVLQKEGRWEGGGEGEGEKGD